MSQTLTLKKAAHFIPRILTLSLFILLILPFVGVTETSPWQMRGAPSRTNRRPGITGPGTPLPTGENAALYMNL
ncbi:MAG: hypothetical protein H7222_10580 [Methylotenera sp.]|nr:hypothetical protein [Oligoflexia bacterium]